MDQGVSAVLGASVSVLGTAGTAVLTYPAARKQAYDQGRVTHRSALRTERREVYPAEGGRRRRMATTGDRCPDRQLQVTGFDLRHWYSHA